VRIVDFAGYTWTVKRSDCPTGPGGPNKYNLFSDREEDIWVDADGFHFTISQHDSAWYCTEAILNATLGYGTYGFQTRGRLDTIDPSMVVGLFTYDLTTPAPNREIDLEFARWNIPGITTNAQYVVQPCNMCPGCSDHCNRFRIDLTDQDSDLTHYLTWLPGEVQCRTYRGQQLRKPLPNEQDYIYSWTFTNPPVPIPEPGNENARVNFWLNNGLDPLSGNGDSFIVTDFTWTAPAPAPTGWAENHSTATTCAEEDNVNVPLFAPDARHYRIVATQPSYCPCVYDACPPDFSGCAQRKKADTCAPLYDDGINVITACTAPDWWRSPLTMTVKAGTQSTAAHYLVWQRKIQGVSSWPGVLVLYQDGNLRLKPQPPPDVADVCYGSSVIIGPATPSERPYVDIQDVEIDAAAMALTLTYRNGETARAVLTVDRQQAVVDLTVGYQTTEEIPFATLRSMWVNAFLSDVSDIAHNTGATSGDYDILSGWSRLEGPWWSFHRDQASSHNNSAPDIAVQVIH
jgi:hypothetical protein